MYISILINDRDINLNNRNNKMETLTINNANVETVAFENLTVEQIIVLEQKLKEAKVNARANAKAKKNVDKAEKTAKMKKLVKAGDKVSFLFGSGKNEITAVGKVVRTSDKSITIEAVGVFKNKNKGYVQFHRVLEVLETASETASEIEVA